VQGPIEIARSLETARVAATATPAVRGAHGSTLHMSSRMTGIIIKAEQS
jgi:hypothetical protein